MAASQAACEVGRGENEFGNLWGIIGSFASRVQRTAWTLLLLGLNANGRNNVSEGSQDLLVQKMPSLRRCHVVPMLRKGMD